MEIQYFTLKQSHKALWKKIVPLCEKVCFRNRYSKEIIDKISEFENNTFGPDITFLLENKYETEKYKSDVLDSLGFSENDKYVVWAVANPWNEEEMSDIHFQNRYKLLISQLISAYNYYESMGYKNVFVPFYHESDVHLINDIAQNMYEPPIVVNESVNIWIKRAIFKYAKACVSMRFHGVAFSLFHGTPVAAISYAPKTTEMLTECGLDEYCCEYGIRESQTFFKEFDLDQDRFYEISRNVLLDEAQMAFEKASIEMKRKARIYRDIISK